MMLGLLRPDGGRVRLFGRSPGDPAAMRRLGYLPENPYFYDYLTATEFLDFYGRLQGIPAAERRRIVAAALQRVGLDGRGSVALRKFSKGMIQRLGLAQAIQHDPDLVILDEPMSGLDPVGRRDVRDLILSLRGAGKTVLFSSHILQDAEMICDHVAILVRGKLRSSGRLDELISQEVQCFEVSVRRVDPGGLPADLLTRSGDGCLLRVPDVQALTRLLGAIERAGGQVTAVFPRRETLEDLFLREIANGKGGAS
jgi:ABC-2 type transport system ATP-binding protein